jgi:Protein of unknown function (DUF2442)
MNMTKKLPRVTDVEVFGARLFRLTFTDGLVREFEFRPQDVRPGTVFERFSDPAYFAQVRVVHGTIEWPGEIDLDPDVLHGDYEPESPSCFHAIAEYWLDQAS